MIPTRLQLHNFLAYQSPNPLVFEGVHLACLTGQNGAGKSSLLDGITWAVWGKARTRHDNDLVHLGTTSMSVELDFTHEGQKYRVYRAREKQGRGGRSRLQLYIYDADNQLNDISEPKANETQRKINAMLRLDYDTFVNSAFLQQGQADAFTVKRPAERKQILTNILGLEMWQTYEERVKGKQDATKQHLAALELRIQDIDEKLQTEPQRQQELVDAQQAHAAAQERLTAAEMLLAEVESAPHDLKLAENQQVSARQRVVNLQKQVDTLREQITNREAEIAKLAALVEQADEIEAGYTALQDARVASEDLNAKYQTYTDLETRIAAQASKISAARKVLEAEQKSLDKQIEALDKQIEASSDDALQAVAAQVTDLQGKVEARDELAARLGVLDTKHATLEATNKQLYVTMTELKERIETLEQVEGADCPLCGQPLTDDHRAELLETLQAEGTTQGDTYRANATRLTEIKAEKKAAKAERDTLAAAVQPLRDLQTKLGKLQQQADEAQRARGERDERQAERGRIVAQLATDDYEPEARAEITRLTAERDGLGYDRAEHSAHQQTLKTYHDYESRHTRLALAADTLPTLRELQASQEENATTLQDTINEVDGEIVTLDGEIERLKVLMDTYNERNQAVMALRTGERQANNQVVTAQQALKALADAREQRKDYEERRAKAAEEKAVYDELRQAFGKNGVPAMIIETAIPELEDITNDLLSRITDGRMFVKFNMQKEKITGGTSETLEIEISDELGTRIYDLYSGGEAFRINFAIRVALSKLLARRAGAHLETLFIDEGFGTQDANGRNKLVEAINAIRDDFALILVITHIDDLKDAFPIHISVEKTPRGSQLSLQ